MIAFIPIFGKIIDALVRGGQMKKDEADAARVALAQAQIQRDQTFASFIQSTSNILYTIMRNAIVGIFAAALVVPGWGHAVSENAAGMPIYFWVIILWEFYGNAALSIVPWMKSGAGNGNGKNGSIPPNVASIPVLPQAPPRSNSFLPPAGQIDPGVGSGSDHA